MDSPLAVTRGVRVLRQVLQEQTCDVRTLDLEDFRRWLHRHLIRWQRDPLFAQRVRIRDLRRACPALGALEQADRRARADDAAAPQSARLKRLDQELTGASRVIAGLTGALHRAAPERWAELERKRETFQAKRQALQREQAEQIRSSPARQALLRIAEDLQRLRAAIGLDREEAHLAELLKRRGRQSGRAGRSFEQTAHRLTQCAILPDLLRHCQSAAAANVLILQGVTLGAARLEFDQVVVRRPRRAGQAVDVLAVVEVKRNINDLAHGFRRRQENLAWLTGDAAGYDPQAYRTRRFPLGHFDREATHPHEGETLRFTRRSFRLFRHDAASGLFLSRLYLITRFGPVWGLSSAALARIGDRLATDEHTDPESESDLRRLRRWCRSLTEPIETPDVLRWYASTPRRGRQILFADR